jgi:hypothetical protein
METWKEKEDRADAGWGNSSQTTEKMRKLTKANMHGPSGRESEMHLDEQKSIEIDGALQNINMLKEELLCRGREQTLEEWHEQLDVGRAARVFTLRMLKESVSRQASDLLHRQEQSSEAT